MRRPLILALTLLLLSSGAEAQMVLLENWSWSHPDTQIYGDVNTGQYAAVISSGPRYMAPGKSLTFGPLGNKTYWVDTGYYYCEYNRDTGRTAVMESSTGSWTNWTPRIFIDNITELSITGTPKLWDTDPTSPDYHYNVVDISYGPRVTRRIRVIEGFVQEFYIINSNPRGTLLIAPVIEQRDLPTNQYYIMSSDGEIYDGFSFNRENSQKLVNKEYFSLASFPVIMDDSISNLSLTYDGYLAYIDTTKKTYATVNNAANSLSSDTTSSILAIRNTYTGGGTKSFSIERSAIYFNTSSVPSGATITDANLSFYVITVSNDDSDSLNITSGQPTYPRINLQTSDYNYLNYPSTVGGSRLFSSIGGSGRTNLTFSQTGLGFINQTGTSTAITKLFLRTLKDIASTQPTGANRLTIDSIEAGSPYEPIIFVYYTSGGPSAPVASFSCTPTGGVRNATRTCTDSSTNTPTSWDWYGTGNIKCIGSNLTNQNPQFAPLNFSYCSLCLIATNAVGSDTECKNNYLWVMQPWVVGG